MKYAIGAFFGIAIILSIAAVAVPPQTGRYQLETTMAPGDFGVKVFAFDTTDGQLFLLDKNGKWQKQKTGKVSDAK